MSHEKIEFGVYLHKLRSAKYLSQKIVADKLGIDISLLSKIEHGERQVQAHMLKGIAELFELNYKELQIAYLDRKIENEFGKEPFFKESLKSILERK